MKQLQEAVSHKTNIVNQASTQVENNYYYTEQVKVKTKNHFIVRWEPDVDYHIEWRFRTEKYYKDLSDVDAEINEFLSELNHLENTLGQLLENKEITLTKQQKVDNAESKLKYTENQLENTQANISSYVQSLSGEHRAAIFAKYIDTNGAEYLCNTIEKHGFDANVLAHIGLCNNDSILLNIAIDSKANLDSHFVEDKTLLQLVLQNANQQSIKKAIDATYKCDHTLLNALNQNDISTLKTLLSYKPEHAIKLIFDESTILQYAISKGNKELVRTIVEIAPQSLLVANNNDETCQQIASRSGNTEILDLIIELNNKHLVSELEEQEEIIENTLVLHHETQIEAVDLQGNIPSHSQDMI